MNGVEIKPLGATVSWTIVVLVICKLVLVAWFPFSALLQEPLDSTLFLGQAIYILEGQWLGPYSDTTLAKGPGYPLWIAAVHLTGLPLLISQELLYIGACLTGLAVIRRFTPRRWIWLAGFFVFLFNPFSYNLGPLTRGYRLAIYHSLSFLVVALGILLVHDILVRRRIRPLTIIGFSLAFLSFLITREEGLWLAPYLGCLLFIVLVASVFSHHRSGNFARLATIVLVSGGIVTAGLSVIRGLNEKHYGVPAVVELKTPEFRRAMNAILSVRSGDFQPTVATTNDELAALLKLPEMSKLQNFDSHLHRNADTDVSSMMFPWHLRGAVNSAGIYEQGGRAVLQTYDNIGAEIEQACDAGQFRCIPVIVDLLPPWDDRYAEPLRKSFTSIAKQILNIEKYDTDVDKMRSIGDVPMLYRVERLTHTSLRPTAEARLLWPAFESRVIEVKRQILDTIAAGYAATLRPVYLTLLVISLLLVCLSFLRTVPALLVFINLSLVGAFLTILALLSILDVTGYSFTRRTWFPAYPVIYMFCVLAFIAVLESLWPARRGQSL